MAALSVVVITKNEARNIEACLQSVRWADELIVVDAQSSDHTVALAERCGARVHVRPWPGYGPQKNFGIEQARHEWVLVVDADERVPGELRDEIRAVLAQGPPGDVDAFEIPRRNFFYGRWLRYGGMYPDPQIRLLRREACRYDDTKLHERLKVSGAVRRLLHPMDHHTMPSVGHHAQKIATYSSLGAAEKLKRVHQITSRQIAGHHVGTVLKTYLLRGAWRDGVHGLIVSMFAGMFTFLKYAKAWETLAVRTTNPAGEGGGRAARH